MNASTAARCIQQHSRPDSHSLHCSMSDNEHACQLLAAGHATQAQLQPLMLHLQHTAPRVRLLSLQLVQSRASDALRCSARRRRELKRTVPVEWRAGMTTECGTACIIAPTFAGGGERAGLDGTALAPCFTRPTTPTSPPLQRRQHSSSRSPACG